MTRKENAELPDVNIILGPPGTGKTENLLRIVDREIKEGTDPSAIAFVALLQKQHMKLVIEQN